MIFIKYKILVIDDEDSILDMLRLNLELEEYDVYTANSSISAMEKLLFNFLVIVLSSLLKWALILINNSSIENGFVI